MQKIDAHQHFWTFDPVRDSWITGDMAAIQRDFLPGDLAPVLLENNFDGCVAVQSDQSESHTDFLLSLAYENDFIKGVVGWVDLQDPAIAKRLEHYGHFKKLKGFRHVLQGETDRALLLKPQFQRGIAALHQFGFTYDILIYPDQLVYIPEFVAAHPAQKFIIDHIAKPYIKDKKIKEWQQAIQRLATYENVWCKISGMVTEAHWQHWKAADFTPYLDVVVEAFGTSRIVFGSDWPVCLVAASYAEMLNIVLQYFKSFSAQEQAAFFGGNAIEFYNL